MKVMILGPIVNDVLSGGVGVFDEGLYSGFKSLGDNVEIISVSKSSKINNIVVGKKATDNKNRVYFSFRKIAKIIKLNRPDLVISSLQYSLGIKKYKRFWDKALYVQVLHGMPCPINGKFKCFLINKAARFGKKHFDKTVTVSFLSYAINKKMNLITCDKVIYNGCNFDSTIFNNNSLIRDVDFIYIGRLFKDKEVEMICDSFLKLKEKDKNINCVVAGYGELENLFTKGKYANSGINYVGKAKQSEVYDLLKRSKFFISMNPLEPFGIVFAEAVCCGCNVITQCTSGCVPFFMGKNYFHQANCVDSNELADRLCKIFNEFVEIGIDEKKYLIDLFSFKKVAEEYKKLFDL